MIFNPIEVLNDLVVPGQKEDCRGRVNPLAMTNHISMLPLGVPFRYQL